MKHADLDVSLLPANHPATAIPRFELREIGDVSELELPITGEKRVEFKIAGAFVISVGFSAAKFLPPAETTDTSPLAHIRRKI